MLIDHKPISRLQDQRGEQGECSKENSPLVNLVALSHSSGMAQLRPRTALVHPLSAGNMHVGYGAAASLCDAFPYCVRQACEIFLFRDDRAHGLMHAKQELYRRSICPALRRLCLVLTM